MRQTARGLLGSRARHRRRALEVLRDIIPGLSRVTALWDPTTGASQVTMTASAALSLNLKLEVLEVRRREEVAAAVRAARNSQADALNVFSSLKTAQTL